MRVQIPAGVLVGGIVVRVTRGVVELDSGSTLLQKTARPSHHVGWQSLRSPATLVVCGENVSFLSRVTSISTGFRLSLAGALSMVRVGFHFASGP